MAKQKSHPPATEPETDQSSAPPATEPIDAETTNLEAAEPAGLAQESDEEPETEPMAKTPPVYISQRETELAAQLDAASKRGNLLSNIANEGRERLEALQSDLKTLEEERIALLGMINEARSHYEEAWRAFSLHGTAQQKIEAALDAERAKRTSA